VNRETNGSRAEICSLAEPPTAPAADALDFPCSSLIPDFSHYSWGPASLIELPDRIRFSQIASIMFARRDSPMSSARRRRSTLACSRDEIRESGRPLSDAIVTV
jgi:hypothetical protein